MKCHPFNCRPTSCFVDRQYFVKSHIDNDSYKSHTLAQNSSPQMHNMHADDTHTVGTVFWLNIIRYVPCSRLNSHQLTLLYHMLSSVKKRRKIKSFRSHIDLQEGANLYFYSIQPDINLCCETTSMRAVHHMVCSTFRLRSLWLPIKVWPDWVNIKIICLPENGHSITMLMKSHVK